MLAFLFLKGPSSVRSLGESRGGICCAVRACGARRICRACSMGWDCKCWRQCLLSRAVWVLCKSQTLPGVTRYRSAREAVRTRPKGRKPKAHTLRHTLHARAVWGTARTKNEHVGAEKKTAQQHRQYKHAPATNARPCTHCATKSRAHRKHTHTTAESLDPLLGTGAFPRRSCSLALAPTAQQHPATARTGAPEAFLRRVLFRVYLVAARERSLARAGSLIGRHVSRPPSKRVGLEGSRKPLFPLPHLRFSFC